MRKCIYWLGLMAALISPSAQAMNQEIRASFRPDPSQPGKNVFVNKTPNSGYCGIYPAHCAMYNMFSIQVPVRFNSTRAIIPGDALGIKAPANWRRLTVTNEVTQESETVEVRIIGIGSDYFLSDSAANLVGGASSPVEGHEKLWTERAWVYAPSPCQTSSWYVFSTHSFRFFWKAPVEALCTKVAAYRIPSMTFNTLDFAYELRTPNPLGMSSGRYTGSLSYTLGPGGDFEMGSMMAPDDSNLTLDFVLDVDHTLKVDLPPGGNKVVLEPEGGWQRWLDSGQKPTRIYRDQLFYISASSRFKVMMICSDSYGGDECKFIGGRGSGAYTVRLFLPPGFDGPGGGSGQTLLHRAWLGPYQPEHYADRQSGRLQFEMTRRSIDFELQPGHSGTYSGSVTVIWDSEV